MVRHAGMGRDVTVMSTILNIIWICTGGLATALGWVVAGVLFYVSIIGIPLGRQAFKMARLTLAPFGLDVRYGGGFPSLLANVVWVCLVGIWEAAAYAVSGLVLCCTIVGIPFGLQLMKMAKLSLMPFGAEVS